MTENDPPTMKFWRTGPIIPVHAEHVARVRKLLDDGVHAQVEILNQLLFDDGVNVKPAPLTRWQRIVRTYRAYSQRIERAWQILRHGDYDDYD